MRHGVRASLVAGFALAVAVVAAPSRAEEIMIVWACDTCTILPEPTKVTYDPTTQLFGQFVVRWNGVDFDFTFPNSQPTTTRQWFWDALNGLPVGSTAIPGSPVGIYPVIWYGDTYNPDNVACFQFRIGSSGAGPRCVNPPFSADTIFQAHDMGTATSIKPPYLDGLLQDVAALGRTGRRLFASVELARTYYAADDIAATCAVLTDFVLQVEGLSRGKRPKLSAAQAVHLTSEAKAIQAAYGCP